MSSVDHKKFESSRQQMVMTTHSKRKEMAAAKMEAEAAKKAAKTETVGEYRHSLPALMVNRKEISFWAILKSCIGKDLTKMVFPVILNEPISLLQRLCEYMEYSFLLDKAAKADNPVERCELVAGFVTSACAANWMRAGKPFNAMLGETYELNRPELGFTYVAEQVSHHPPVTALHAEGKGYDFHGSISPRLSFWGKSIDVTPKGTLVVHLQKYNETYYWQNVHCYVHNIIIGELWMELHGQVTVTCNKSDVRAVLNFKEVGWNQKDLHFVEGQIYTGKKLERVIYGSWVKGMYGCSPEAYDKFQKDTKTKTKILNDLKADADLYLARNAGLPVLRYNFQIPGQRVLWEVHTPPIHTTDYYNFSHFTMSLNQMPKDAKNTLPPTDSRFRPDQQLFENGKTKEAEEEKIRIELKQRQRKVDDNDVKPMWFKWQRLESIGKEDWVLDKNYFKRNWSKCPNLF